MKLRRGRLTVISVAAIAVVAALAACGGSSDVAPPSPPIDAEGNAAADQPPTLGSSTSSTEPAGDLPAESFERFDGSIGSFADYQGRPLVVNFFASWCAPCLRELPAFAEVHRSLDGEVEFFGMNLQDDPAVGRQILEDAGVSYDAAFDPDGVFFQAFGGFGMPTTVFVNPDGTFAEVFSGEMSGEQLREKIEKNFGV